MPTLKKAVHLVCQDILRVTDPACLPKKKKQKPSDIGIVPTKLSETTKYLDIKLQNLLRALQIKVAALVLHTGKSYVHYYLRKEVLETVE